jgi:hypothetical protein
MSSSENEISSDDWTYEVKSQKQIARNFTEFTSTERSSFPQKNDLVWSLSDVDCFSTNDSSSSIYGSIQAVDHSGNKNQKENSNSNSHRSASDEWILANVSVLSRYESFYDLCLLPQRDKSANKRQLIR